jgi:formamidopyrimidine-DNA glycosylase
MPELPEVEHVVRYLKGRVAGKKIKGFTLQDPSAKRRATTGPLEGRLGEFARRGKLILIRLAKNRTLVFHLKLTGKLWVTPHAKPPSKWTRLTIHLGALDLHFEDTRRFGWFDVVDGETLRSLVDAIGPEPLEDDFTLEVLEAQRRRRRGPIKPVLLDQAFVAGIGNIYADEILHESRIHPLERIETLEAARMKRLHQAIVSVLARAVAERSGVPGQARVGSGNREAAKELTLSVFQRTGEPCPRCGTKVERIVVRGRGTHLCPRCQPAVLAPSPPAKPMRKAKHEPKGRRTWATTRSSPSRSARTRRRSSSTRRS